MAEATPQRAAPVAEPVSTGVVQTRSGLNGSISRVLATARVHGEPSGVAHFLAATPVDRRAEAANALQRTIGNRAVTRILQRQTATQTTATDSPQKQRSEQEDAHLNRNRFNVLPTGKLTPIGDASSKFEYVPGGSNKYRDEAGLIWQLEPASKTKYHQPPGHEKSPNPDPNKKLLHRDASGGSSEAIRRPDGTYITTGPLQGTYNFVHPEGASFTDDPVGWTGHGLQDVIPHEVHGSEYVQHPPLDPTKVDVDSYRQRYKAQVEPIGARQTTNVTDPIDRQIKSETGVVWIKHSSGYLLALAQATNGRLSFVRFIDNDLADEALARGNARQPRGVQRIQGDPPHIFNVPKSIPANAARP